MPCNFFWILNLMKTARSDKLSCTTNRNHNWYLPCLVCCLDCDHISRGAGVRILIPPINVVPTAGPPQLRPTTFLGSTRTAMCALRLQNMLLYTTHYLLMKTWQSGTLCGAQLPTCTHFGIEGGISNLQQMSSPPGLKLLSGG